MGQYAKLKLPVSKIYDKEYWEQVQILNKKEFAELGVEIYYPAPEIIGMRFDNDNKLLCKHKLPVIPFNEPIIIQLMQQLYNTVQKIGEIDKGKITLLEFITKFTK